MNGLRRFFKKFFIILVILAVAGGIFYLLTIPKPDPCTNGKQDVGENGIDCGGFCATACPLPEKPEYVSDIRVIWVKFAEDGRNNYSLVAKLANDNADWGVESVNYVFTYYDEGGNIIGTRNGITYMMPKGANPDADPTRYLIEQNVHSNIRPSKADLKFSNAIWKQITSTDELQNLNTEIIKISTQSFSQNLSLKTYYAGGITKNTSKHDFEKVDISAVLFGKDGGIVAAGNTDQNTMVSGDGWGFSVLFPNFTGTQEDVERIDCRAQTNVLSEANIIE